MNDFSTIYSDRALTQLCNQLLNNVISPYICTQKPIFALDISHVV